MRSVRLLILGLTVAAASLMVSGFASAATVTLDTSAINEIGNAATSVVFSASFGTARCTFTLRGTLATSIAAPLGTTTRIGSITGVTGTQPFPCTSNAGITGVTFSGFPYGIDSTLSGGSTLTLSQGHSSTFTFTGGTCSSAYTGTITGNTSITAGTNSVINTTVSTFGNLSGSASISGGPTLACPNGTVSGTVGTTAVGTRIIR
jgi:hypothetical protein